MCGGCGCEQCAMMHWGLGGMWKALKIVNCIGHTHYVLKSST